MPPGNQKCSETSQALHSVSDSELAVCAVRYILAWIAAATPTHTLQHTSNQMRPPGAFDPHLGRVCGYTPTQCSTPQSTCIGLLPSNLTWDVCVGAASSRWLRRAGNSWPPCCLTTATSISATLLRSDQAASGGPMVCTGMANRQTE